MPAGEDQRYRGVQLQPRTVSGPTNTVVRSVASNDLHTIRFKSGDFEFELISSAQEVAKAREALTDAIATAFSGATADDDVGGAADEKADQEKPNKTRAKRPPRRTAVAAAGGGDRKATRDKLLAASVESFPQIGDKPTALLAAMVVVSWAHKKLGIDGLTSQEIQVFLADRRRIKRSYQAYAAALDRRVASGEVDVQGNNPKVYRLMAPGETTLADLLTKTTEKKKTI